MPIFDMLGDVFTTAGRFVECHAAAVSALATIVIAGAAIFQWITTRDLWRATFMQSAQAERAIVESARAVNAMRDNVALARERSITQMRAYVFPVGVHALWDPLPVNGGYNWRLRPNLQNTGLTPTRDLRMRVECVIRDSELPDDFDFARETGPTGSGMMAPHSNGLGSIAPAAPAPAITPHDILEMQAGRRWIYLWGWIKYYDVFPGTPEHITRFCWAISCGGDPLTFIPNAPGHPPALGTLSFGSNHWKHGNCADEECTIDNAVNAS